MKKDNAFPEADDRTGELEIVASDGVDDETKGGAGTYGEYAVHDEGDATVADMEGRRS